MFRSLRSSINSRLPLSVRDADHRRDVLLLMLGALLVRLAALPWVHTVHADAVSRIHIAYDWLLDPHYIKEGSWGPLHHYLNALFMLVIPGKTSGPLVLNILCATLSVIPIYGFTRNVFASRPGAVMASLVYVLSPIVIWTSLQALSEAPYGLFLSMSMYALTLPQRPAGDLRPVVLGGVLLTCAAAIRYEAWVIIAAFSLVVLLQKGWRHALIFSSCAMVFPATWMIGNWAAFGDPLYSVSQNDSWTQAMEGLNDELLPMEAVKRTLFLPWSFMVNVSPVIMLSMVLALLVAMVRNSLSRAQWTWLIPLGIMVAMIQHKVLDGSLFMQHRFVLTLLVLALPFVALVFRGRRLLGLRIALVAAGFLSVIPLTYYWNSVDHVQRFGDGPFATAMDDLVMAHYREMEVVPRLPGPETDQLLALIDLYADAQAGSGLVLDFHGWDKTYYLQLHAHANTLVVGGAKHESYDPAPLVALLSVFGHGQLVFSRTGMLKDHAAVRGRVLEFEGTGIPLLLGEAQVLRGLRLFTYHAVAPDHPEVLAAAALEAQGVFPSGKDAEYFDQLIRNDERWYNIVRREAFREHKPVDEVLRGHVGYLLYLDQQQP